MRKIFIYMVLLLATSLMASEINWEKDFKSGIDNAQKENKPVLFIFSRHTCKYCVILDEETLKNEKVVTALNKDFTSIISYSDENDYTPRELWRPGTPTIWFLKPNGEPMFQPLMGALGVEDFLYALGLVKTEFDSLTKQVAAKTKETTSKEKQVVAK
jgi:thioredoxin-related protein